MWEFLKKIFRWAKESVSILWTLFKKECKQKKIDLLDISRADVREAVKAEAKTFFVSGAKKYVTHSLRPYKIGQSVQALDELVYLPYDPCFLDNGFFRPLKLLTSLGYNVIGRLFR